MKLELKGLRRGKTKAKERFWDFFDWPFGAMMNIAIAGAIHPVQESINRKTSESLALIAYLVRASLKSPNEGMAR